MLSQRLPTTIVIHYHKTYHKSPEHFFFNFLLNTEWYTCHKTTEKQKNLKGNIDFFTGETWADVTSDYFDSF